MAPGRRLLAVITSFALVALACSDNGETATVRAGQETTTAESAPAPVDQGAPDTTAPSAQTPSTVPSPVPDSSPATVAPNRGTVPTSQGSVPSRTAPPPSVAPIPPPGAVGGYAPFFLRPVESTQIVLEIRSQTGAEPRAGTVDHLERVLGQVSEKPVSRSGGTIGGGARQWSADDIRALADQSSVAQSRGAAVLRVYFLRGGFADGDGVLGVAVRSDVAAVFGDRVEEASSLLVDAARIEDAVTIHEIGHLLGLVDLVLPTGRQDPEHPGHSRNMGSVMYFAVESALVGSLFSGGPPTEFDGDDLADLASIRNS